MSQEEIDTHLSMFKDGVVKILSKDSFDYSMATIVKVILVLERDTMSCQNLFMKKLF